MGERDILSGSLVLVPHVRQMKGEATILNESALGLKVHMHNRRNDDGLSQFTVCTIDRLALRNVLSIQSIQLPEMFFLVRRHRHLGRRGPPHTPNPSGYFSQL